MASNHRWALECTYTWLCIRNDSRSFPPWSFPTRSFPPPDIPPPPGHFPPRAFPPRTFPPRTFPPPDISPPPRHFPPRTFPPPPPTVLCYTRVSVWIRPPKAPIKQQSSHWILIHVVFIHFIPCWKRQLRIFIHNHHDYDTLYITAYIKSPSWQSLSAGITVPTSARVITTWSCTRCLVGTPVWAGERTIATGCPVPQEVWNHSCSQENTGREPGTGVRWTNECTLGQELDFLWQVSTTPLNLSGVLVADPWQI